MAATLTSKSQVTLPKPIRDYLRVGPGDRVEFRIGGDGSVRVEPVAPVPRPSRRALARYRRLRGSGGQSGGSTDELMRLLRGYDEDADDPGFAVVASRR
jgi:AbrB family looped-hinge helix DNA binding protein